MCAVLAEYGVGAAGMVTELQAIGGRSHTDAIEVAAFAAADTLAALARLGDGCAASSRIFEAAGVAAGGGGVFSSEAAGELAAALAAQGDVPVRGSLGFVTGGAARDGGAARRLQARAAGRSKAKVRPGATAAVRTADVTLQQWQANDTSLRSAPLLGAVPPVRSLGDGNAVLAGLLLRQVCPRLALARDAAWPCVISGS